MAQGHTPGLSHGKIPEEAHAAHVNNNDEAVRAELNRVLASHEFRTSKRSQEFLRYVVEATLGGHADILKERTIGIEVFGRSTDYDPSDDATVRVKAGEVRKRLSIYYSGEGAHDSLRIELPAGTYIPEFRVGEHAPISEEPSALTGVALPLPGAAVSTLGAAAEDRRTANSAVMVLLGMIAIAVAGFIWWKAPPAPTVVDQFWAPVLQGSSPVSICAAFVPVYSFRKAAPDGSMANSNEPPKAEDFISLTDQYVGGGDLIAVSRLSAMLTKMQRPYIVKLGNAVSFHDLKSAPAILVGYSYTRWKEISSQMRYFIDGSRQPIGITDAGAPTKWELPNIPADRRTNEDYAIVSRVFHPDTHAMLVEVAGITQYGTDAAADLVTNADLLGEGLRGAPNGWQSKNLQMVLHVKVISGTPSSPKVVATHFW
jgi:hypothetical protein